MTINNVTLAPEKTISDRYFVRTTQLSDPMRPLSHLPRTGRVRVHALVATLPDPVETHLGRSFDMVLSAALTAYQSQRYVLDGYAFPWVPASGVKSVGTSHREIPGVLLFRRDRWREGGGKVGTTPFLPLGFEASIAPEYAVVFLVGEAPSYGVHLKAFQVAARCAATYNTKEEVPVGSLNVDERCDRVPTQGSAGLDVLGPAFSGSMQSMAIAIGRFRKDCDVRRTPVLLVSPSATVDTNRAFRRLDFIATGTWAGSCPEVFVGLREPALEYFPMAWSLDEQFRSLRDYLCSQPARSEKPRKIALLVEESTFGRNAEDLINLQKAVSVRASQSKGWRGPGSNCGEVAYDVRTFPPDISSIRAEHLRRRRSQSEIQGMPRATTRLLELDMTALRDALDRPIVYEPGLTSRSDQLMLYRMFDSLRMHTRPDAVVILATDVRDRLFLLGEVRNALPAVLPVMMELDFLAIHPDYRDTSRGAVFVPAGDSIVCLNRAAGPLVQPCKWNSPPPPRTFAFATDFAANAFRSVVLVLRYREGDNATRSSDFASFTKKEWLRTSSLYAPRLYVATLAGFSGLGTGRSSMAAADTRLVAQLPAYVALTLLSFFFMILALWVSRDRCEGRVMLPVARNLFFDSRWIRRKEAAVGGNDADKRSLLLPRLARMAIPIMGIAAIVAFLLAVWRLLRLTTQEGVSTGGALVEVQLAHGRDIVALVCIWLIYGCVCLLALSRVSLASRRLDKFLWMFCHKHRRPKTPERSPGKLAWLIPMLSTVAVLMAVLWPGGLPWSVDSGWPWIFAVFVLAVGVAFLVNVGRLGRLIGRVTLYAAGAIPQVREYLGVKDWPTPHLVQELPSTPFNVILRQRNVQALADWTPEEWARLTCQIIDSGPKRLPALGVVFNEGVFQDWQAQLVAELKLCIVALRTCAWCGLLAPIAVLMGMTTYPPIFERTLTTFAMLQLIAGFAVTVVVVLRLEQDPVLGPMFTRSGDTLTFGGGLRALWPKFVAMGVVLIPLVAPNVWRWLHSLIQSINSLD